MGNLQKTGNWATTPSKFVLKLAERILQSKNGITRKHEARLWYIQYVQQCASFGKWIISSCNYKVLLFVHALTFAFQSADSKKQSKFRFANLSPAVLILNSFNLGLAKSLFDFESQE